jgi:hypothetical protein
MFLRVVLGGDLLSATVAIAEQAVGNEAWRPIVFDLSVAATFHYPSPGARIVTRLLRVAKAVFAAG